MDFTDLINGAMRTGTKIFLGLGLTVVATGFLYYRGIYKLQYCLRSISFSGTQIDVAIAVTNPTIFRYPVPRMFFNVYDTNGTYYGTMYASQLQWVFGNRVSILHAALLPNYSTILTSAIQNIMNSPGPLQLVLDGALTVGKYQTQIQLPINQELFTNGI